MATPDINKILAQPSQNRSSVRGAPLGDMPRADDLSEPLYLQKLRLVDGDYGADGTYCGGTSDPMWCAFNPSTAVRIYQRAKNRMTAILLIEKTYPTVKFKNNTLRVSGKATAK